MESEIFADGNFCKSGFIECNNKIVFRFIEEGCKKDSLTHDIYQDLEINVYSVLDTLREREI